MLSDQSVATTGRLRPVTGHAAGTARRRTVMAQDRHNTKQDPEVSGEHRDIRERLEALVRCLARSAAEKDYRAFAGPAPAAGTEDRS